jgi:hypothetical protein
MAAENYYEVLGLRKGANDEEVKQAFRELAKTLHPDRNPGDPEAERQFKLVNTAYEALKDGSRRRAYDEWLAFARKHDRSRLAQWGRLAALVAVLLIGPSMALYWALVALDLAGPSRKDRERAAAVVSTAPERPAATPAKRAEPDTPPRPKTETAALPEPPAPAPSAPVQTPPPAPPAATAVAPTPAEPPAAPAPVTPAQRAEPPATPAAPRPAQRAETPPPAPSDSTASIETPAPIAPPASRPNERRPLRELAGADDGRSATPEYAPPRDPPPAPPEEAPTPIAPRRSSQATDNRGGATPLPQDAEPGGAARSMARALAELKEPERGSPQPEGTGERQPQRQASLPPEEEQRPPSGRGQEGDDFADCERCPTMSVVVATDFSPSDAANPAARRGRPVRTLAISRSEVTVAQWNACVRDGACPGLRDSGAGGNNRPVLDVSRSEAVAYADWLSRKTGKFYRPMKSGGWSSGSAGARADTRSERNDADEGGPQRGDCGNRGEWRWMNDEECNRQARRAREAARPPARDGADASGFRVARSIGPDE